MKVVLIGIGQAGGKIGEALLEFDDRMGFGAVVDAVAVNTAKQDLAGIDLPSVLVGQDRVKGHGVGADNELGAEIMQSDLQEVMDALDGRITAKAEAIVVVAGLGGGTGSGGAPVLCRELRRVYDLPVYGLGALPGEDEGGVYQVNAGRSLRTLVREADATLLVDNDSWHSSGESMEEGFAAINRNIAQRVGLLLAAGEQTEEVAESVVDSSEVINTLRSGGVSALGYASAEASDETAENVRVVTSTTRNALYTGTSLPEATSADAALLVVAGAADNIPRKGVESARKWLEEEVESMEVRGGDFPLSSERIATLVLLGGVERSDRVQAFLDRAREAQAEQDDLEEAAADPAEVLQSDDIEGLF